MFTTYMYRIFTLLDNFLHKLMKCFQTRCKQPKTDQKLQSVYTGALRQST